MKKAIYIAIAILFCGSTAGAYNELDEIEAKLEINSTVDINGDLLPTGSFEFSETYDYIDNFKTEINITAKFVGEGEINVSAVYLDPMTNDIFIKDQVESIILKSGESKTITVICQPMSSNTSSVDLVLGINNGEFRHPVSCEYQTDVEENGLNSRIEIYPNPVSDYFEINISGPQTVSKIEIYNALGEQIKEIEYAGEPVIAVSTAGLPRGAYILQIRTKEGILAKKLIVN